MAALVVIPARYGSTRFAAKILASDTGRPLVQHVVDQVRKCKRVSEIVVATDDLRIVDALKPFDTTCVMTSPTHQSGTDRVAEVARGRNSPIVLNVQGDEPEIDPDAVDGLIEKLETLKEFDMATPAAPFPEGADPADPNLVKVIAAPDGRAIYFSRLPIPFHRDLPAGARGTYHLHLGVYAYRRDFLLELSSWKPTPLELTEKLEQLRVLEHGRAIYLLKTKHATSGIDTAEQYAAFVRRWNDARAKARG